MRAFLSILLVFMFAVLWSKEEPASFSKEYVQRVFNNQKLFLWKIEYQLGDEKGYESLSQLDELDGNAVQLTQDVNQNLLISSPDGDVTYRLISYKICSTTSKASKELKNLFKAQVRCIQNTRGSYPYLLMIGQNNNEILKEIKDERSTRQIIPAWYDYQVVEEPKKGSHP